MNLKDVMKSRRAVLGLSQSDLSEMTNVSLATIKDIERGKANPTLSVVLKIIEVLGMEIDFKVRQTVD